MTFTCEVCHTPLRYHGGPHNPRWCDEHREGKRRVGKARYIRACRPPVYCSGCRARLLRPAEWCGFCIAELGIEEERVAA